MVETIRPLSRFIRTAMVSLWARGVASSPTACDSEQPPLPSHAESSMRSAETCNAKTTTPIEQPTPPLPSPQKQHTGISDFRGLVRLGFDAVAVTTQWVEATHCRYDPRSRLRRHQNDGDNDDRPDRLNGWEGYLYRTIHSLNNAVATTADVTLEHLVEPMWQHLQQRSRALPSEGARMMGASSIVTSSVDVSHRREAAVAVLNGVVGDYLAEKDNPLAISMQWRIDGVPLDDDMLLEYLKYGEIRNSAESTMDESDFERTGKEYDIPYHDGAAPETRRSRKLLLLVHGSCSTDLMWGNHISRHNHGSALAEEFDMLPLYLFYNTGLHISDNGQLLAQQIDRLMRLADLSDKEDSSESSPSEPWEITILAHSMGGLVTRSALHYASVHRENKNDDIADHGDDDAETIWDTNGWLDQMMALVCLGTPHHGALLERGGQWIDHVLSRHWYTETLSWIGKIRSRGVTDLGFGNIRHEDWSHGQDDEDDSRIPADVRLPTPLPEHVRCCMIAAICTSAQVTSPNPRFHERQKLHFYRNIVGDGLVSEGSALGQGHINAELNLNVPLSNQKTVYGVNHVGLLSNPEVYQTIVSFLEEVVDDGA